MSWRPHPKLSRTDPTSPRAWATSDRSGFIGNQENLIWQTEWQGTRIVNLRFLVYSNEFDQPQRQLGTIILPPDPVSIMNARIEPYAVEEQTYLIAQNGQQLFAQNGTALLADNLQGATNAGTYPG
jgi:hypothetical protein